LFFGQLQKGRISYRHVNDDESKNVTYWSFFCQFFGVAVGVGVTISRR
jgi:hypothetical protein